MIRMSETTWTHTTGQQLDCDILISSLMKHVLTNRPMFHSDSEKLRREIWATKFSYPDQTWHIEKEKKFDLVWDVHLSLARFWYSYYWSHDDGTNCRPVSLISLTETMCLIEKTGDNTHWWGWGGCNTPLPPKFRVTHFLGSKRDLGKANFYKSFHVLFSPFLCFERSIFFYFKLKSVW